MKFRIIAVGRGMPKPIEMLVDDYMQRLRRFLAVELIEVTDERRLSTHPAATQEPYLKKEADRILSKIHHGAVVVPLDLGGKTCSSDNLAKNINHLMDTGVGELCFLIGGPDGLHGSLLQGRSWRLSFGPMTFPHMLARVILLEQLYRAMTILKGLPYHR